MNDLAGVLKSLNELKQSEKLYRDALNIRLNNLIPNHPAIATTMNGLAEVLKSRNRLQQSEKLHREALNFR